MLQTRTRKLHKVFSRSERGMCTGRSPDPNVDFTQNVLLTRTRTLTTLLSRFLSRCMRSPTSDTAPRPCNVIIFHKTNLRLSNRCTRTFTTQVTLRLAIKVAFDMRHLIRLSRIICPEVMTPIGPSVLTPKVARQFCDVENSEAQSWLGITFPHPPQSYDNTYRNARRGSNAKLDS